MARDDDGPAPTRRRVALTGISSRAWEHPADRGALTALRELRGFDDVVRAFFGMWNERGFRLSYLAAAIRVDHRQYPRVHQRFVEAATALDVPELPELYVTQSPWLDAESIGLERPFIVLSTACVQQLDDDELRALLGHELGHVRSGHAVYKTILSILTRWAANLSWLPVGAMALRAIMAAMLEWWRKAELSADRAGLLAGQDPAASLRLLMKLAGGGDLSQIDTAAFLEQAAEYDGGGDLRDSLHKIRMTAWSRYPVPVARAADLRRWIDDGGYGRVLGGDYPRRDDDGAASASEEIKAAADSYRESFGRSQDPLVGLLRRLGDGATDLGEWVGGHAGRARAWMGAAQEAAARAAGEAAARARRTGTGGGDGAGREGSGDGGR
ncbi:Zn-dependent protease with chaperone function [Micromonospora pattaloongensis]|uniref:Zn-dependent protease with chaperone function n=1 Tax=Micromonospora pattaloongensis TaxID=405436 RepID=A0A1H3SU91_9ACTN|nr:M48 family metallopeptidase [Micromonospora pattaloongensis]SDZ41267.1 Zn-dependent protease with chaperone function [Micromonospora pattaloongensis]